MRRLLRGWHAIRQALQMLFHALYRAFELPQVLFSQAIEAERASLVAEFLSHIASGVNDDGPIVRLLPSSGNWFDEYQQRWYSFAALNTRAVYDWVTMALIIAPWVSATIVCVWHGRRCWRSPSDRRRRSFG
jgi:hypothetical protein